MRYVGRYRCEAIQCRGDNIRIMYRRGTTSTLDCFAAFQCYVSQVRWRLRKDGQGQAQPCPGAMRRDGGRSYARAMRGKGGFETRPYGSPRNQTSPRNPRPNSRL
ncbi:MAG: hypothetical protein LBM98_00055 [Oscillospiraceae bacterium]|nr:hypothetical protein [Oscillospiraceae bacterium]